LLIGPDEVVFADAHRRRVLQREAGAGQQRPGRTTVEDRVLSRSSLHLPTAPRAPNRGHHLSLRGDGFTDGFPLGTNLIRDRTYTESSGAPEAQIKVIAKSAKTLADPAAGN
jgi:hypothetical protein